ARAEHRSQAARERVALPVALVRLLVDFLHASRSPDVHAQLATQPPCGALVAARREADREDVAEPDQRLELERQRVDQDDPAVALYRMCRADIAADPLVGDAPAPDARQELLGGLGDSLRLCHEPESTQWRGRAGLRPRHF